MLFKVEYTQNGEPKGVFTDVMPMSLKDAEEKIKRAFEAKGMTVDSIKLIAEVFI